MPDHTLARMMTLAAGAMVLATTTAAGPAMAQGKSGLDGIWRNDSDSVRIRVAPCGGQLCGTVVQASTKAKADAAAGGTLQLVGTQLFSGFRRGDDGLWYGRVYVPDIGQEFDGTIDQVDRDTIVGKGCLFANFACKSQTWRRVPGAQK
ncbi:DUF2147 domain-containing protein [Sphingomonas sp.]|uniref:DUF2147 domain-containing protein n=1 Tax=Sphingomonas sp. TaxID=28214 RepID=UPI0026144A0E|nr:DUF2147 domain-containing protein [Sphingomonas sp.]MDF2604259.1 hypothetical protein [Sphingomonas sp.]